MLSRRLPDEAICYPKRGVRLGDRSVGIRFEFGQRADRVDCLGNDNRLVIDEKA